MMKLNGCNIEGTMVGREDAAAEDGHERFEGGGLLAWLVGLAYGVLIGAAGIILLAEWLGWWR